jgi:hypothetical protein
VSAARTTAPQRSPERERLAQAIANHARAVERLTCAREAWGRLRLAEASAAREKARAEQELAASRENAPRLMVDQLLGGQTEDTLSVENAEEALKVATRPAADAG